jgi:transposase
MPGLGTVLGARMLGEVGDDRERFTDARGLEAFAGTAPVTRASGTKSISASSTTASTPDRPTTNPKRSRT